MDAVPEDAESLKNQLMAEDNGHMSDLLKAADGDMADAFECPECNGAVPADANTCPNCGVEFEMDEVFECPMCKSMIDVNVNKCPSCGAEFEEESAEPESVDISSQIVESSTQEPEPTPEPEPEVPAEPVSFADRLKQVRDDPTAAPPPKPAEPPKELSFADRMKAMKNETPEESEPAPVTTPAPAPAPVPEPQAKPAEPEVVKPIAQQPATPAPVTAPEPKKEAPKPAEEQSFSDRMKAIKQAQEKPGPEPTPASEPQVVKPAGPEAVKPITQPSATPAPTPASEPQVVKPAPDPETAKKESYKELPRYIGDVKKLLLLANELKIDISASKALINQAVTAGKKRDLENAIKLVKEGKIGLERDLRSSMINKLRTLQNVVLLEKKAGKDVSAIESDIADAKKSMDAGDFNTASNSLKKIDSQMGSSENSALPQAELEVIAKTIEDAVALRINIDEAKSLYDEAKMAVDLDDNEKASELAKKAGENLTRVLPGYIASEMRKAKVTLREIKMMNVAITKPVNILKEVNNFVKEGDYCEALSSIKKFKDFVDQSKE